eukprot:Gregarina_sp_Pseudo_9__2712@NODE_2957_length_802_cov_99_718218_g2699_i0_p1_GENE_NODE_2957_length_802_cov_99_718218_g2699_i0NODE_2957_length_802_cov_99_718218_g2699_i0_p1_ORF_typecomplete_len181_score25_40Acetyltransf_1/PF00583_25/4_4e14Acetyltransf_10/PF13673_7/5_3e12FR47/PF08445_10/1_2e03FR47/PF08445_10/4_6e09Acetyltransf_7/PF13508_7/9_5e08Acetyltransf_9/PF13527_7/3_7e07Acetyltransf_4/PF13420_7/6_2e07Acetyltransf_3/PF13302_7/9e07GNAT_acetyltran/PF12746_7/4_8e03GNAT_acetyltran/PF12746_7/6_7e06Ac
MTHEIFEVRDAVAEDVPTIVEFARALSVHVGVPHRFQGTVETVSRGLGFRDSKAKRASAIVGVEKGMVVAVAIFFRHFNTWEPLPGFFLDNLYITPEARGRGYGRRMVEKLMDICKADGGSYLEWLCDDENYDAQKMYTALGAERVDCLRCFRLYESKLRRSMLQ